MGHRLLYIFLFLSLSFAVPASQAASRSWTQKNPSGDVPAPRIDHEMVYDAQSGLSYLFGGFAPNDAIFNDTWSWDGTSWAELSPASSPSPRWGFGMVYDSQRDRTVLFGGCENFGVGEVPTNDTWEFDGTNWTLITVSNAPPARCQHEMAYDPYRGVVVLFGGGDSSGYFDDTWEFDGNNWVEINTTWEPDARVNHGMAYDPSSHSVIVFGGCTDFGCEDEESDTWEYHGHWHKIYTPSEPGARYYTRMVLDNSIDKIVLLGGVCCDSAASLEDSWTYRSDNWLQQTLTELPPGRWGSSLTYDSQREAIILFGGFNNGYLNEIWEFTEINDPAVANDDSYSVDEDNVLNISAPGILANDTDATNDSLSALLASNPSKGYLVLNTDGSFSYTPNQNFNGVDSFTYRVDDGTQNSNVATVTLTINAVNDLPIISFNQSAISVDEAQTAEMTGRVLDVDGDLVTLSTSLGEIGDKGFGAWEWLFSTHDGPTESQTVTVSADDGHGVIAHATFVLTVNNVTPDADAGPNQTVLRNDMVSVSGSFSDPATVFDGTYLWSWDINGDDESDLNGSGAVGDVIGATTSFAEPGLYVLSFSVTDKDGDTGTGTMIVDVQNQVPDCSTAVPSIGTLYPPDNQFHSVSVLGVTDPEGDAFDIVITRIFQDEQVDSFGDGTTHVPDGLGVGTDTAQLRAERDADGNGRVYHIYYSAKDEYAGTCWGEVLVAVPIDLGIDGTPRDDGALDDSSRP